MTIARRQSRTLLALLSALALLLTLLPASLAPAAADDGGPHIVISQVYGGGGNAGAPFTHDYVELFNRGDAPASLGGLSIQYASATGTGNLGANSGQLTELPTATLAPGQYYLVQQAGGTTGAPLPQPDLIDPAPIAMAAGAGKVVLAEGTSSLGCNGGSAPCSAAQLDRIIDLVGYGSANLFEGSGAAPGLSNTTAALRAEGGCQDTDDNAEDFTVGAPAPRNAATTANDCEGPGGGDGGGGDPEPPTDICAVDDASLTRIHAVQGDGLISPMVGASVTIEGVVIGDFTGADGPGVGLGGFHVQELQPDLDPATSEGVYVLGATSSGIGVGDVVRVRGTVQEFVNSGTSQTQIGIVTAVGICGAAPLPDPVDIEFPLGSLDDLEPLEGMRVRLAQDLVISEYFNYDRFGEIVLSLPFEEARGVGTDRIYTPTNVVQPGADAIELAADIALRRITLDDGQSVQNPSYNRHPNGEAFTLTNRFRGGDVVTDVVGVLDHTFGLYRIQPTQGANHTVVNPRPEAPAEVGGRLTVASFNVLNYFLTLDEGPTAADRRVCGPLQDSDCRGADDAGELERQRTKILAALAAIDADVVGLIEMENTAGVEPLADLVAGLNDLMGVGTYDYVDTGVVGSDAIRNGLIFKPGTVAPVGDHAVLDGAVDARFLDTRNRPVIAQTFEEVATGERMTVAVNHLKSKGSDCNDDGDPDAGDGQGNCNGVRTAAALALRDWLAGDPTGSGDPDVLIIGDLNAYALEDPIMALVDGGYTDLVAAFEGVPAYTYVFDGQFGYLDHALSNGPLTSQVTGATVWTINADEPDILDYDTSFKPPTQEALFEPNAFRSSDHDPVIVGLELASGPGDPTAPTRKDQCRDGGWRAFATPSFRNQGQCVAFVASGELRKNPAAGPLGRR